MRFRKKSLSKHFEEVATSRLLDSVKKNLQLDWTKKEDARAAIRLGSEKGITRQSAIFWT